MEARTGNRPRVGADTGEAPFPQREYRMATAEIGPATRSRPGADAVKAAFDAVMSALALIVLAPLFAAIAIAIKLDSPGPAFFAQSRIGRGGIAFPMLKFRTMVDGADAKKQELLHLNEAAAGLFKISSDPRVTRFGAFLRSTSLDELPQLINVLRGEMSIVGPRPLVEEEDIQIAGPFRRRLDVRPGMTGPWQVAGASQVPLQEMAALDYEYVETQSFSGDIALILSTIPHVIGRRGV